MMEHDGTCRAVGWNADLYDSLWTIENSKVLVAADALSEDKEFICHGGYNLYQDLMTFYVSKEFEVEVLDVEKN